MVTPRPVSARKERLFSVPGTVRAFFQSVDLPASGRVSSSPFSFSQRRPLPGSSHVSSSLRRWKEFLIGCRISISVRLPLLGCPYTPFGCLKSSAGNVRLFWMPHGKKRKETSWIVRISSSMILGRKENTTKTAFHSLSEVFVLPYSSLHRTQASSRRLPPSCWKNV